MTDQNFTIRLEGPLKDLRMCYVQRPEHFSAVEYDSWHAGRTSDGRRFLLVTTFNPDRLDDLIGRALESVE